MVSSISDVCGKWTRKTGPNYRRNGLLSQAADCWGQESGCGLLLLLQQGGVGLKQGSSWARSGVPLLQYLLQLPFVLSLQWRQQQKPLSAPRDSASPSFPLIISPSFSMSSNSLSLIPAPHPFVQNIAYNADKLWDGLGAGVEWNGKSFLLDLKTGGNPGACVWNIEVGDQCRVPQGIAVLHCIPKFSEDAAVQAAFPCCRAEGLWERACAQQSGSLLLRPTLRFHFMHVAKQACSFTLSRYFYISLQMLVEHQHLFGFKPELKFPTNVWRQNQKGKYFSQN